MAKLRFSPRICCCSSLWIEITHTDDRGRHRDRLPGICMAGQREMLLAELSAAVVYLWLVPAYERKHIDWPRHWPRPSEVSYTIANQVY